LAKKIGKAINRPSSLIYDYSLLIFQLLNKKAGFELQTKDETSLFLPGSWTFPILEFNEELNLSRTDRMLRG